VKKFNLLFLFIVVLLLASCDQETEGPVYMGYEYFPDQIGHWVIYDVDSTFYDDFTGLVHHYQYQVKELNHSTFIDGTGRAVLLIERYIRDDAQDTWRMKNIWQARRLAQRAERNEENVTFIKLAFPLRKNHQWDGNAFNYYPSQQYRYVNVHEAFSVNDLSFDSTATVLQKELYTLISEDLQQEVYAKNVGLLFKRFKELSKTIDGTVVAGVDYSYTINSFGND
jgi:hypothetical protein